MPRLQGFALLRRLREDRSGTFVILGGLLMPVLIGAVGLGTEVTLWLTKHRSIQAAADSSAVSAATAYYTSRDSGGVPSQAEAVSAAYGYVNGTNGVAVTANRPPLSGNYTTRNTAVEVIIQQPQQRLFTALWFSDQQQISSRAVALGDGGLGCVISLHPTASQATKTQGAAQVVLNGCSLYDNSAETGCALQVGGSGGITALSVEVVGNACGASNITTTDGLHTGQNPTNDPYAERQLPAMTGSCLGSPSGNSYQGTVTLNPGRYCKGFSLNAGANVTLNPGIYYMDRGSFSINGGASLTGNGVTIVFTSSTGSNYADATVNGGANVNITAPSTGPTAGIAFFGDRDMPTGTAFRFNGGATQVVGGAIYLSDGDVTFAGGANTTTGCTQLVASTITFTGNSNFALNCAGLGTGPIGTATARLVE
jgi:hypothetical protein